LLLLQFLLKRLGKYLPAVFFFTSNGKRKAAASEGSPLANRAASGAPTTKAGHVMTSKPEPVTGRIE
jgi:hypothetical protein